MHSENASTDTALIVIDVQESFRHLPTWAEISNPDIVSDVQRAVDAARAAGHHVIWVTHASVGPFDPAGGLVRLIDPLQPRDSEPTVRKTSRNAFTTTELDRILTQRGVGHVAIAGIQTEQCCESTARLASDFGYRVTFVTEATATFPIVRPDTGERVETSEVIARTEATLAGRFARIRSIDDAFTAWTGLI